MAWKRRGRDEREAAERLRDAIGDASALVRSTRPWLARIDEATNVVTETFLAEPPIQGPLTVDFGSIWTVAIERDTVYRIAP